MSWGRVTDEASGGFLAAMASPEVRNPVSLLLLILVYGAAGYLVEALADLPGRMNNVWYETTFLVYPLLVLWGSPFAFAAHRWAIRDSNGRWIPGLAGWRAAANGPATGFLTPSRVAWVAVAALLMPLFLNTYGSWKGMLPALRPFSFDQAISEVDRALHFGRLPWEHLQPLLGRPAITRTIDVLYILWLPLNASVLVWQGWSGKHELKARFFLSYVLIYIVLGTGMAIALSSAGPCYYSAVTGQPSPYAPLLDYLGTLDAGQPLIAVRIQRTLWENYASGFGMPFVGISAMPSVHVAVAVLFALVGWRTATWLGWLLTVYALVVLVGSIHLGWHYAVDGYVSIVGGLAIWAAVGAVRTRTRGGPALAH
ncbi:MAG: phosphatase PAP2 family protein [Gemmatimonadales bacterium]|nr:phosphatase PAP2 family protein [Gemmatimonadales bacterium]